MEKPNKKTDADLFKLLTEKIDSGNYIFLKHARQRLKERFISDIDVLNILSGKIGYKRKRNKRKDTYKLSAQDWNYCIEGIDIDRQKIRIIFSFLDHLIPIITVIKLREYFG